MTLIPLVKRAMIDFSCNACKVPIELCSIH